ncbi:MAG: hypothetical protein U5R30_19475 [Deltaproteobacteria bacterium]|nr:hypothetical protein [Deltaproteobacteria bacterium]
MARPRVHYRNGAGASRMQQAGAADPVPVAGSEFTLECDAVIPAIGQRTDICGGARGRISNGPPAAEPSSIYRHTFQET